MSRGSGRAVLFEFIRVGAYVKVIAVDERTGMKCRLSATRPAAATTLTRRDAKTPPDPRKASSELDSDAR